MELMLANIFTNLDTIIVEFLNSLGIWGAILSCLLITVESIVPELPVCVFITLEFYTFGAFWGFVLSWIFTCLGCVISFSLCRKLFRNWVQRKIDNSKNKEKLNKLVKRISDISMSNLAVLVAIPFTPASFVNVCCGLSKMSLKKFVMAMLIGKIAMVYFWGYVGTTLIDSLTHPIYLIKIGVVVIGAFIISKALNRYLKID